MIRKILALIITWTTLLLGGVVLAHSWHDHDIDVMNLPKLEQHVTDFAWVLDSATLDELNAHAAQYEQSSAWRQFVAVLFPNRQWRELFDIALATFNENGIWTKQNNDGLLLMIATEEKKIRIMVGYGLEGEMPDILASKIIENDIRPLVNAGDFAWAIKAFYVRSEEAISTNEAALYDLSSADYAPISPFIWFINILWFILVMGFDINRALKDKKTSGVKKWEIQNALKKKRRNPSPIFIVFIMQFAFLASAFIWANKYILWPFIAAWVWMFVYITIVGNRHGSWHGGRSSGGSSWWSSGGFSSSSSSSSFSGGGGSSGGGGAGD